MKFLYGLATALLGTTLLAGAAAAKDNDSNPPPPPPPHPHFSVGGHGHGGYVGTPNGEPGPPRMLPPGAAPGSNAKVHTFKPNGSWSGNTGGQHDAHIGSTTWTNPGYHWNPNTLHEHNVSHWSAQDRTHWQHGEWRHGHHNGRDGWWWYTNGAWFYYDQPIYPYPGYVSDYYYDDYDYGDYPDDGYAGGYAYGPNDEGGYYWYYCSNPAGYYPYVKTCRGPWRAVSPTPDMQQGTDQSQAPDADDNDDQGPPPQYNGYGSPQDNDQFSEPDNNQNRPPPGYANDSNGQPPGYDNGPDDDGGNGPPPQ